jgi:hypothetical protein
VRLCAARTVSCSRSSALMISAAIMALNCRRRRSPAQDRGIHCRFPAPLPAFRFS